MNKIWIILSLVTLFISDLKSQDTVKVATYNLLRYGSNTNRNIDFKKVIDLALKFNFYKNLLIC